MPEQPGPPLSSRRRLVLVFIEPELELIAFGRRRLVSRRIGGRLWHDLFTSRRVARKETEVTQQMPARRGHRSNQPHHEVVGLEHDRARAVFPRALEAELEPAVGQALKPVLCNRWASDIAAEPLEPPPVATVHALFGVHVDAPVFGDRLVGGRLGQRSSIRSRLAEHQPERRLPGTLAAHADALRGSGVASSKPGLVEEQLGQRLAGLGLEAPAALSQQPVDALGAATRHLEHLCPRWTLTETSREVRLPA
jgi:hypothetical protein